MQVLLLKASFSMAIESIKSRLLFTLIVVIPSSAVGFTFAIAANYLND
mgnify:CR=1 FL=1